MLGRFGRFVVLLALGCGGRISGGPQGDAALVDVAVSDGAADAMRGANCPTSLPSAGSVCTVNGIVCEFGSDPSARCNTLEECRRGVWALLPSRDSGTECPTPLDPGCPGARSAITEGSVCMSSM